ncbi:small integral membrane protein 11A-like [Choloepus didactylus]|uniref:small integral membrane protein 11A-like n=1 Tax=Choloepus didactylus TaxID=27675 RepID=UPI00189E06BD|nr:small integral membrane protein 11A-like [Choloepus didactylus]
MKWKVLEHVPLLAAKTLILCLTICWSQTLPKEKIGGKTERLEAEKMKQSEKKDNKGKSKILLCKCQLEWTPAEKKKTHFIE